MFGRRGWFGGWGSKPRNLHSTEHLKHLYTVLCKNQVVTEQNKDLLVETLRSISEILIWGDQNDGSVFDFFLEKNMLSYFVKIMRQKQGRFVCTQLLQTLNILFENIRQDTSLYYLLSNNHVNTIIVHKFDFTDEEVMAYYISFIKTLSLKLTSHTIHFFYNEHTNDFPLYTEAIKFFKHPESMVRIAVRTLTLNVFKVQDEAMQRFIRDRTAAPYFSNLVWFIGKNVLELDSCAAAPDHKAQGRLADLVAEHLDQLHYLNDILCLDIAPLNEVLTDHLLNRLFLPLYIYSLAGTRSSPASRTSPHVSPIVALFLLNQVFLIISHAPLVRQLADVLFNGTMAIFNKDNCPRSGGSTETATGADGGSLTGSYGGCFRPEFIPPEEPLELSLQSTSSGTPSLSGSGSEAEEADAATAAAAARSNKSSRGSISAGTSAGAGDSMDLDDTQRRSSQAVVDVGRESTRFTRTSEPRSGGSGSDVGDVEEGEEAATIHSGSNITDEEKIRQQGLPLSLEESQAEIAQEAVPNNTSLNSQHFSISDGVYSSEADDGTAEPDSSLLDLSRRPFLAAIFDALSVESSDHGALFALSLLYALGHNSGINQELLDTILLPAERCSTKNGYNGALMARLMRIIRHACVYGTRVRLATLEMAILLIKQLSVVPADVRQGSPTRQQQHSSQCQSTTGQPRAEATGSASSAAGSVALSAGAPAVSSTDAGGRSNHGNSSNQQQQQQQSTSCLRDAHLTLVKRARDESALLLKGFLKSDEIFLDMFEEEYEQGLKALNVEYLMMDGNLLLPPIGTPMSGLDFHKRLPCGEVERAIRAIRAFFLIRHLCLVLRGEAETELPLTKESDLVRVGQVLDLTNNDLVACTVYNTKDNSKLKRFMVIDSAQVILVEPEATRLGFGVVRLAGMLQDIEVTGDQHDSRALHITIHRASGGGAAGSGPGGRQGGAGGGTASSRTAVHSPPKRPPLLAAKFIFDDHIRCMAAKQKLTKGRLRARQRKMQQIAKLLDMNISSASPAPGLPMPLLSGSTTTGPPGSHRLLSRSGSGSTSSDSSHLPGPAGGPGIGGRPHHSHHLVTEYAFYEAQRVFGDSSRMGESTVRPKIPGSAVPAFAITSSRTSADRRRVTSLPVDIKDSRRKQRSVSRSRESSPRTFAPDEEIPLEDLSGHSSPRFSRGGSPLCSPTRQQQQQHHQRSGSIGNNTNSNNNSSSSICYPYVNGVQSNHCDSSSSSHLVNGTNAGTVSDQFITEEEQRQVQGPVGSCSQSPSGVRDLCETSLDQLMGPLSSSHQTNSTATSVRGQVYDI